MGGEEFYLRWTPPLGQRSRQVKRDSRWEQWDLNRMRSAVPPNTMIC